MHAANQASQRAPAARLGSFAVDHAHLIVAVLMVLASALGFLQLGVHGVILDESVSISHAHESWPTLWQTVSHVDPNMSLYYVALKIWTGVFGDGVFAVRSLSVVAGVLCVPVVYAIGARLFGVPAGLIAGLLLATNVFFLRYAQEARSYALLTLLTALSTYFFLIALETMSRWSYAGYVGSSVLAFHAHYFAAWVTLIQVGTLVAVKGRRATSLPWLACYGVIVALVAPMAIRVLTLGTGWIDWIQKPSLDAIPATYAQLAGNSFLHLGAVFVLCMLAVRRAAHSRRLAFGLAFTAALAFLPVLATFAFSQVKPVFLARYFIICVPAVVLLVAGAISTLRPAPAAVAVCVLIALSVPKLRSSYEHGFPEFSGGREHDAARLSVRVPNRLGSEVGSGPRLDPQVARDVGIVAPVLQTKRSAPSRRTNVSTAWPGGLVGERASEVTA